MQVLSRGKAGKGPAFAGKVPDRDFLGPIIRLRAEIGPGTPMTFACFICCGASLPEPGQTIRLAVDAASVFPLD